jgi:DNA-binding MarR family transcriptional regulator
VEPDTTHLPPAEATPARLRELPSRLLGIASGQAQRLVGDVLAAEGTRKWHYATLAALEEFGPASQSALSDRTGIYRSDLVATLNELTDGGYVKRTPDPDDRRRNVITLTAEGRRRLERLDALLADVQNDLLAPLTAAERADLVRLLTALIDHRRETARRRGGNTP